MRKTNKDKSFLDKTSDKNWSVYEYSIKNVAARASSVANENERTEMWRKLTPKDWQECTKDVPSIVQTNEEVVRSYSLSDLRMHEELLEKYCNISDELTGLNYVREYGLPGTETHISISNIVESAAFIDHLLFLSRAVAESELQKLMNCCHVTYCRGRSYVNVEIGKTNGERIRSFRTYHSELGTGLYPQEETPLKLKTADWESSGKKAALYAVQQYLKNAVNNLLVGTQPSLDWKKTLEGDWVLDESISVDTPWQAVCYEVLRDITGKGYIRPCKWCHQRFRPKRKDNYFHSDSCNRAYTRKHGKTVHKYERSGGAE